MATKVVLVLGFALFCFLQYTAAQTVHTVGDSTGWRIPPNAAFYANWAAGKTFAVGDSLVFNFTTDLDDVTRVPRRSFDLCSDDNEIGDSIETGPATIVLSTPGEYYFISSEDTHCQQGQKFAINVTAAPRAPTPPSANRPTPTPTPGRAPVTHVVGDAAGWRTQQGGAAFYVNWAAGKTFVVGDSLVFNFVSNMDDVVRVTRRSFDLCSDDDDIGEDIDISPATIVLSTPGEYYFISSEDNRCQQGQKLAINVTAAPRTPMPPPSANPPTSTPGRAPVTHVVGDTAGWRIQQGGAAFYVNWAAGKTFVVGDSLVFNFASNMDDVVRVTRRSFDLCSDDDDIGEDIDISPATIVLTAPGEYYFISSENNNCQQGQKLAINVSTAAPGPMTPPSNARPPPSTARPVTHVVGDAVGWTVPQGGAAFYTNWAARKTFVVGDSLVFNFQTDVHDVQRVTKRSFDLCSDDEEIGDAIESGPATITLTTAGEHYYISSENRDCQLGQKLAINVVATRSNGPATSIATPPTSGLSPVSGPGAQPTPAGSGLPNSSASTVVAALSATLFGFVLNFF